ncbi:AAA family ATPase [Spirulina major CS-329]|uniref:AAA family ATPase n=1 Tax=Spirulina TaxID=1154 RepID=UPI002330D82A|nr:MULTISPECIES: AAA family ATPase [Spirulina]MDB9494405.1 AAA family ATPase [Spirulina subsalsa CS-330]MDB9503942.1 AAA family ATPase [Spirulina major CS-329]
MLESLSIKNFRCFEHLDVQGFKRVNLIGGKNNAGKTALLEALLLYFYPTPQSIIELKKLRKEATKFRKSTLKLVWDTFFYDRNTTQDIEIQGIGSQNKKRKINISNTLYVQQSLFRDSEYELEDLGIFQDYDYTESVLKINLKVDGAEDIDSSISANSKEIFSSITSSRLRPKINTSFGISNRIIAQHYDLIRFHDQSNEVLKILQILDPSIENAETFSIDEPTLYLTRKNQQRLPISLFGDAVNRVISITLELLDRKQNILLIDEIENGIHYSSQQEFWDALFKLANELDTMIFATTHSLEMIKAFARAGHDYPGDGAYFELARSPRDDQIVAINRDIETLDYALERGKPIRGE